MREVLVIIMVRIMRSNINKGLYNKVMCDD